jgi:hypothetical protein
MRHHGSRITPEQAKRWLARIASLEHRELRPMNQRLVDHFMRQIIKRDAPDEGDGE